LGCADVVDLAAAVGFVSAMTYVFWLKISLVLKCLQDPLK
jgi:hypothetical protein